MTLLSTTDIEKRRESQRKTQERRYAKHMANLADPAWRKEQSDKRYAAGQRQLANRLRKQQEAKLAPKEDVIATTAKQKPVKTRKTSSKSTSKGLLGRNPTAAEKRIMNKIGQLPCECCARMGRYSPAISLHHTDGRVDPLAHAETLPLCCWHHDTDAPKEFLIKHPDLVPVHAKGSWGGKAAWERIFGSPFDMQLKVWEKSGATTEVVAAFTKLDDDKIKEQWREKYPKFELFELPNQ